MCQIKLQKKNIYLVLTYGTTCVPQYHTHKDSNQVLLYSMHTTKGNEVSNNSSKGRDQLLIMLPSYLREFT
jgi:hypothetical protein